MMIIVCADMDDAAKILDAHMRYLKVHGIGGIIDKVCETVVISHLSMHMDIWDIFLLTTLKFRRLVYKGICRFNQIRVQNYCF